MHAVEFLLPGQPKSLHCDLLQVDLDDMECRDSDSKGQCMFLYPCRCGSQYSVQEADLSEQASSLLVQCLNCSLVIKVVYTVVR